MSNLVSYSDSGSDNESDNEGKPNRKKLKLSETTEKVDKTVLQQKCSPKAKKSQLPLPDSIVNLFSNGKEHEDDPSKHGGRIRTFSHEKGNWATLVYIPYEADTNLKDMTEELLDCLRPLDFHIMEDFHISLSRTVSIRHHWIQSLIDSLQSKITSLPSFPCEMTDLKFYTNDEKTRSFLAMEVTSLSNSLSKYVSVVDQCFEEFKLQTYYKKPSYHISLAWCIGDVISKISEEKMSEIKAIWKAQCDETPELRYFYAKQVECKTGNKLFTFEVTDS